MARKAIVGVIGGNGVPESTERAAERAGCAVARAGAILLSGGWAAEAPEVKCAAMRGAMATEVEEGCTARLIGVCPGDEPGREVKSSTKWLMKTGLSKNERNLINGVTPDVLLMFEGGPGTLSELVFAFAAHKPVLYIGSTTALDAAMRKTEAVSDKVDAAIARFRGALAQSVLNRAKRAARNLEVLKGYCHTQISEPPLLESSPDDTLNDTWAVDLVTCALSAVPQGTLARRADFPGIPQGISQGDFDNWLFVMP